MLRVHDCAPLAAPPRHLGQCQCPESRAGVSACLAGPGSLCRAQLHGSCGITAGWRRSASLQQSVRRGGLPVWSYSVSAGTSSQRGSCCTAPCGKQSLQVTLPARTVTVQQAQQEAAVMRLIDRTPTAVDWGLRVGGDACLQPCGQETAQACNVGGSPCRNQG